MSEEKLGDGEPSSAPPDWIQEAAEDIFGLSVEAEYKRGPEWGVVEIAAAIRRNFVASGAIGREDVGEKSTERQQPSKLHNEGSSPSSPSKLESGAAQEVSPPSPIKVSKEFLYAPNHCCGDAHQLLESERERMFALGVEEVRTDSEHFVEITLHNRRAEKTEGDTRELKAALKNLLECEIYCGCGGGIGDDTDIIGRDGDHHSANCAFGLAERLLGEPTNTVK